MYSELLDLPLEILTALGAGYFGYITAYGGMRRGHSGQDIVFLSLAFSAIAMVIFGATETLIGESINDLGRALVASITVLATVSIAIFFRRFFRGWWYWFLRKINVHMDDGTHGAWDAILQIPRLGVSQLSVHTKDGRVLYMQRHLPYAGAPFDGMLFGSDGSVSMIVEEERMPDGTERKCGDILDSNWGTRITYIPADQIHRVNLRVIKP